jgi:predicted signal transduction protein with EAL and GGDEF domain
VGTSIGIALSPGDGTHPAQLLKNADLALYRAKREGRGTWRFFEPTMDAAVQARRKLELDLRHPNLFAQLELHYQPVLCSRTRQVTGFEALLRWHHPTRGMVSPADFIPVAEEIGVIVPIGAWVLRHACAEAATWPDHLNVAVNLSPVQFRGRALVATVADALANAGVAPRRLALEITETVLLEENRANLAILHDLRQLGTRIAMDDFGTGHSSLSYLRGFPFDTIKIDRSFVAELPTRDECLAIVRAVTGLAGSLHMNMIAEGVETEAQFAILAAEGCTEVQGYLFSKPVPASELPALIARLSANRVASPPALSAAAA